MADKNISRVYLLKSPLEKDYLHTLAFNNTSEQYEYFSSKIVKQFDANFSYVKRDKFIRVPAQYDEVYDCNYVMYQNPAYNNKWFYAFITDVKHVNDERTDIYIETDVIQTWKFNYEVMPSFIEREHVKDDTIGLHTQEENLEIGHYVVNDSVKDPNLELSRFIAIGSSVSPGELQSWVGGRYGGLYSGVRYYSYPYVPATAEEEEQANGINRVLQMLTDDGKEDAVSSVFLLPKFLALNNNGEEVGVGESLTPKSYVFEVNKKYGFEGYTPKNNKLKTYPYTYLLASNGNGGTAEYRYEYFESSTCDFVTYGVLTPGCSIRMMPTIYRGVQLPEIEGLNLGKFPQCNWATDQYTNWLTQNGINVGTSYATGSVSAVGGAFGGAVAGMKVGGVGGAVIGGAIGGLSGLSQIMNTIQKINNAERVPPQTQGNINCGDVVTATGNNTFTYYNMSIKKEYAEIIDQYFSAYGYKVNLIKKPNYNHRKYYWFTKTIDANIKSTSIPREDLEKIKNCYDNGITFWKYSTVSETDKNFKNYDLNNVIVE